MKTHRGSLEGANLRVCLIASRFNSAVTERLLTGALEALRKHGVAEERIEIVHVPGAFEIPLATEMMAQAGRFDALVCLGAVVRGETPHFHYISRWVVSEIGRLSVAHRLPIALGVLTTDSMEQALQRSAPDRGNKGYEAALTAIEMANLRNAVGCKD